MFSVLFLIAIVEGTGHSSFLIKTTSNDIYLYQEINGDAVELNSELKIKLHVTKLPGLLFYLFKEKKKTIVILEERQIKLTFQGQNYSTSLQQLCKCDPCLYQPLTFRFQVNDVIQINCNSNEIRHPKLTPINPTEEVYSFPEEYRNINSHLYLVNIPPHINFRYDHETLAGCIHDGKLGISYLTMKACGRINITETCTPYCNQTFCNDGQCLETFEYPPLCDCQFAYNNGDYCNSTLWHGFKINSTNLQFEILKISWISSADEILKISNGLHSIIIVGETKDLNIAIDGEKIFQVGDYSKNDSHLLIMSVNRRSVEIKYKSGRNSSWTNVTSKTKISIFHENFNSVTFLSDGKDQKGDLVYKTYAKERTWLNFKTTIKCWEKEMQVEGCFGYSVTIGLMGLVLIVLMISLVVLVIRVKFLLGKNKQKTDGDEETFELNSPKTS